MHNGKRIVLITGASGDIGNACADLFANEHTVLILQSYRNTNNINLFRTTHPNVTIYAMNCDLTSEKDVDSLFAYIEKSCGINTIDVLVNNAGDLIERCTFSNMSWGLMQKAINVNLKSAFLVTSKCLNMMAKGSSIIFVSSMTARCGKGDRSLHYGVAKAAVLGMVKCLAYELGPKQIRVNAVAPGFIEGQFHNKYTLPEIAREHSKRNPLGRIGTPEDVAKAIYSLSFEGSQYINGVTLDVCGGAFIC